MTDAAGGSGGLARREDIPHCASESGHGGELGPGTDTAGARIPALPWGSGFTTSSARQTRQGGTRAVCAGFQGPAVRMRACAGAPPLLGHAADSRPAPLPPPPRLHRGWKRGWGARQCHPSHRDLPLLPGGSTVRQLVSRDSVQAWSGGGEVQWGRRTTRPPWDGRPGWSHPGLTPGLRVPAGHRTSVTVWAAVLWLSGRSHLLRQKRGWGSGTGRWQEDSLRPAVGALLSLGGL